MKTAIRFDQGSLRKPEMLPHGFMKVEGYVARAGVLEYRNDDGSIRRELRLREDVADPKSLSGYEGASLTDGHPTVLVDADNVRTLEDGTATSARMDGDWVVAPMVIKSKKLISKVKSGKTGLSAGYTIRLDETPGVHPVYGRYDAIQRDIRINHIAVAVDVPRAGDGARIRMDGALTERADSWSDAKLTTAIDGHQHLVSFTDWNGQSVMSGDTSWAVSEGAESGHSHPWVKAPDGTVTIGESDGHAHALLDESRYLAARTDSQIDRSGVVDDPGLNRGTITMDKDEQIRLLQTQLGEANKKLATAEGDLKTRTDERDDARGKLAIADASAKETQARLDSGLAAAETEKVKEVTLRLDEANAKIRELEGSIPTLVRDRAALNTRAVAIMGGEFRADSMGSRDVLEATNLRIDPKADVKKMSDVELKARFDAFFDSRAQSAASTARLGAALAVRADARVIAEIDPFDPLHNGVGQYASPHAAKKGA